MKITFIDTFDPRTMNEIRYRIRTELEDFLEIDSFSWDYPEYNARITLIDFFAMVSYIHDPEDDADDLNFLDTDFLEFDPETLDEDDEIQSILAEIYRDSNLKPI